MTVCVPIKDMKNTAEFTDTVRGPLNRFSLPKMVERQASFG